MRELGVAFIMHSVDLYRCALYPIPVPRCVYDATFVRLEMGEPSTFGHFAFCEIVS